MKAMAIVGPGRLELRDLPMPQTPPDGVLAKVEAVAVCNATDLRTLDAPDPLKVWPGLPWPLVIGHETCARVMEVGAQVTGWQAGDRIAGWCPRIGGFAEYCVMYPERMAAVKVPEAMPATTAAMLELLLGSMRFLMGSAVQERLRNASAAFVAGLGPAGLLYVQELGLLGFKRIYACDRHPQRQALARRFGAEVFAPDERPEERLAERGVRADVAVDTTGKDLSGEFLGLLRNGGVLVPFGVGYDWTAHAAELGARDILMAQGTHDDARRAIPILVESLMNGRLPAADIITRTIRLEELPEAFDAIRRREEVKVVVVF